MNEFDQYGDGFVIPTPKLPYPENFSVIWGFFKPRDFFGPSPLSAFCWISHYVYVKPVEHPAVHTAFFFLFEYTTLIPQRGRGYFFQTLAGDVSLPPPPQKKKTGRLTVDGAYSRPIRIFCRDKPILTAFCRVTAFFRPHYSSCCNRVVASRTSSIKQRSTAWA